MAALNNAPFLDPAPIRCLRAGSIWAKRTALAVNAKLVAGTKKRLSFWRRLNDALINVNCHLLSPSERDWPRLNVWTNSTKIRDNFLPLLAHQLPYSVYDVHDSPALLLKLPAELDAPLLPQGRPINAV